MTTTLRIGKPVSDEFLSDILITAFDGSYGYSWMWFEPGFCEHPDVKERNNYAPHDESLVVEHGSDDIWREVHIKVKPGYETGYPLFDENVHIVVDHAAIAQGIERIINDDYVGVWRTASEAEYKQWTETFASCDFDLGTLKYGREWRRNPKNRKEIQVHTGESARGLRSQLAGAVAVEESGDIDAPMADCIVQCAVFGKVIFG